MHLTRAATYAHPCALLLRYHDSNWLLRQRSEWVGVVDNRTSVIAGRSGTRLNIGRPQVRWTDGVECAKCVCDTRSVSTKGSNALSISIRIRDTITKLTNLRITASALSQ